MLGLLLSLLLTLSGPMASPPDQAGPACEASRPPTFSDDFAALKAPLGATMGEPIECERTDAETGRSHQRTTTGVAYRGPNTPGPTFTNGTDHWALTPDGVTHWTGWHATQAPSGAAEAAPEGLIPLSTAHAPPMASVEVVTILGEPDGSSDMLVVSRQGSPYRIRTSPGCLSPPPAAGQVAFIASPDTFAGSGSHLILSVQGHECPIVESRQP